MWKWMVEFLSKFQGRGIKIDRVNCQLHAYCTHDRRVPAARALHSWPPSACCTRTAPMTAECLLHAHCTHDRRVPAARALHPWPQSACCTRHAPTTAECLLHAHCTHDRRVPAARALHPRPPSASCTRNAPMARQLNIHKHYTATGDLPLYLTYNCSLSETRAEHSSWTCYSYHSLKVKSTVIRSLLWSGLLWSGASTEENLLPPFECYQHGVDDYFKYILQ